MVANAPLVNMSSNRSAARTYRMEIESSKLNLPEQPIEVNKMGARNVPRTGDSSFHGHTNDRFVVLEHDEPDCNWALWNVRMEHGPIISNDVPSSE